MKKIIGLSIFLISFAVFSQQASDTITVKMEPASFKQVVLYAAEGAQQKYVSHATSTDGNFKIAIPHNAPHASYRLVFDQQTMDYIDFLYLGKSFSVTFNPKDLSAFPRFINSEENNRYYKILFTINGIQQKMDSIQIKYFQSNDASMANSLTEQYVKLRQQLSSVRENLVKDENNELIRDILNAHYRVLPDNLMADPKEYLQFVKIHFFDHIDFNSENLFRSSILLDKVMDYVFYLTLAETSDLQNEFYVTSAKDVLNRIHDEKIRKGFIQAMIQSFAQDENVYVIDYLFENYYNLLPAELQNSNWKMGIQQQLKTAVGRPAYNFDFIFKYRNFKLYDLKDYKYYVIAFWSTSCPHCLQEIPMFYDYIKNRADVKVLAIGLETNDSKGNWESEVADYPDFVNILGLGKWENPIAQEFNIHATPNYFVLDANKVIISKPYDFEALENLFDNLD